LCNPNSALQADIDYGPGLWGSQLLPLVEKILGGYKSVPKVNYSDTFLLTKKTVRDFHTCP
jgi:hypothetical protein